MELKFKPLHICVAVLAAFFIRLITFGDLFQELPGRELAICTVLWLLLKRETDTKTNFSFVHFVVVPALMLFAAQWLLVLLIRGGMPIPISAYFFSFMCLLVIGIIRGQLVSPTKLKVVLVGGAGYFTTVIFYYAGSRLLEKGAMEVMAAGRVSRGSVIASSLIEGIELALTVATFALLFTLRARPASVQSGSAGDIAA